MPDGEQDDHGDRLVLERLPLDRVLRRPDRKRGLVDAGGLAVRDGDAHADAGRALLLAPQHVIKEALPVVQLALLLEQVGQTGQHLLLAADVKVERDELLVDDVGDVELLAGSLCHIVSSSLCVDPLVVS